jgi:myo-inositol-1(or 4)-monophosphatase
LPAADSSDARDRLAAVVREAGALALKTFRAPVRRWTKGQSSPVSEADIAVDNLLRERLAGVTPADGWLSEETEDDLRRLDAAAVWIVDPIDGTRSYLDGREDWVVSVALAARGRPVLAAIFAPATDEMFLAKAGGGATLNGQPIVAPADGSLAGAKIAGPKRFQEAMAKLHPQVVPLPRIGALALRLVRVAHGGVDVSFAGGRSHDWDLAAADLLVHEAGGLLTGLDGEHLLYNRPDPRHGALIAAGRSRHETIVNLLREGRVELP